MIYEYLILDQRFHAEGLEIDVSFATNDLDEAKIVADEMGAGFVVVQLDTETQFFELVYDAGIPRDLGLNI